MNGPVFLEVELAFGLHRERWELSAEGPTVVAGPNGSGKSTLIDGLLRTVYGFHRRKADDRRLSDARRPWNGEAFRSSVRLRTAAGEVLDWSRDQETDEVRVVRSDGEVLFAGEANPGASGSSDARYWDLVERTFGLDDLEDYARTAWVAQGEMLEAEFGQELLALAEGGHARLTEALDGVKQRHKELTKRAVHPDERKMPAEGLLEEDRHDRGRLREALAEARGAERDHAAAEARLAEVDEEARETKAEVERLESARSELADLRRLDAEADAASGRLDHLLDLQAELDAATAAVKEAETRCAELAAFHEYPADFPTRVDRLRDAWEHEHELEKAIDGYRERVDAVRPRPLDTALPGVAVAAAALLFVVPFLVGLEGLARLGAWAAGLLALLGAAFALWRAADRRGTYRTGRQQLEEKLSELDGTRKAIDEALGAIPDSEGLRPADLDARLASVREEREAVRRRDEARRRRRDAVRRVEESAEAKAAPGRTLPRLIEDARRRLAEIEVQRRQLDEARAEETGRTPPTERALDDALRAARGRRDRLQEEREGLRIRLDRAGRVLAEAAHLERDLAEIERRIDENERAASALRAAYALLRDGYEEFREHDESRLVDAIAGRLDDLGGASVTDFRVEPGLTGPTVELAGRRVSIDSPALSHGQRHLVALAIRLGAADFLSSGDVAVPLIVDEPFAHLDERNATRVWELLERVSSERQVIVATQEVNLLEKLDVHPHVRLRRGNRSNGGPAVRLTGERGQSMLGVAGDETD